LAEQENLWCLYPSLESRPKLFERATWHGVKANVTLINDHGPYTYNGMFVDCPLDPGVTKLPLMSVSTGLPKPILSKGLNVMCETGNILPVNHGQFQGPQVEFGACIKVLHSAIPSAQDIVEFVEFSRLLGVEHFTFYNDTTNERSGTPAHVNASCALRCYKEQGLVDVMDFGLDIKDVPITGSIISTNDCVYKRRHQYKHHVQVDTDEFIVPRAGQPFQYHEFLPAVRAAHNISEEAADGVCEYGFQMSFFPQACRRSNGKYRHETVVREAAYGYKHRSKYISVTKNVIEAGPHYVYRGVGEKVIVSPNMALVHHYRNFGNKSCSELTEDRTVERYQKELDANIDAFLVTCESRCGRLF
jgi:hypothetical protein